MPHDSEIDCLVIGAGVIGLAVARALALEGREVLVLERERQFGSQTSSRNSEVIHAGLYYVPGSLKAQTCVEGRDLLYAYCERYFIPHRRCGKLIVATSADQVSRLEAIQNTALSNGVTELEWLSGDEARGMEPSLHCVAALYSPYTGIIDSHAYMLSLLGVAETHGASIAYSAKVTSLLPTAEGIEVTAAGESPVTLRARTVINAAGLQAMDVAAATADFPAEKIPRLHRAKGTYFTLAGRSPFKRMIYPVPEDGGLGIHLTIDLAGQARFGPDVEWTDDLDYRVNPERAEHFYPAIWRYWPNLRDGELQPAYSGIRPKLSGPGMPAADFVIAGAESHGVRGLIHLFGIDSPGLTASLAVANRVVVLARSG